MQGSGNHPKNVPASHPKYTTWRSISALNLAEMSFFHYSVCVMRVRAGRELWLIHFLPQYTHDKDEWTDDYDYEWGRLLDPAARFI